MKPRNFYRAVILWRRIRSRQSVGEGGCGIKITEDVREFAAQQRISEEEALRVGLEQKAKKFREAGVEVHAKA